MTSKSTDRPPPPAPSSPPPPPELTALWDMDSADYECDCPGPPPEYRLPPPPRPTFLQESSGADCSEAPIPDLETCDAVPVSILHAVDALTTNRFPSQLVTYFSTWRSAAGLRLNNTRR